MDANIYRIIVFCFKTCQIYITKDLLNMIDRHTNMISNTQ